jgi:hypothetical protein
MDRRRVIGLEVGNNPDQHRGHRRFLGGGESIPCCLRPVHAFDLNHTRKAGLVTSHMGHSRHFDRGGGPFRSTPINGHARSRSACLQRANNGLTHCSETATFSFATSCLENYRAQEIYDKRIMNHLRLRFADTAHERKVGGPLNRIRLRSWTMASRHGRTIGFSLPGRRGHALYTGEAPARKMRLCLKRERS